MANIFWGNANSQPKRKHRFALALGNSGLPEWIVVNVKRPTMEISTTEHQYLNHTFKFPGRAKWQDVSVTLRDPLTPDASQTLYKVLENAGYTPPNKDPGVQSQKRTFTKAKFGSAVGMIQIQTLDAEGAVKEIWKLHNPIITNVDWGQFDYGDEGLLDISLNIAYDYATIETVA